MTKTCRWLSGYTFLQSRRRMAALANIVQLACRMKRARRSVQTQTSHVNDLLPWYCRIRVERLLPVRSTQRLGMFALVAFELLSHPEQRTEMVGRIIAGLVNDPGFDDEAAEFEEVPRASSKLVLVAFGARPVICACHVAYVRRGAVGKAGLRGRPDDSCLRTSSRTWTALTACRGQRSAPSTATSVLSFVACISRQ
jgi:hypothetical protein